MRLTQQENDVTQATETGNSASTTLEERVPELLDDVLGRLSAVGVQRILALAGAMVEARIEAPATAHLSPTESEQN